MHMRIEDLYYFSLSSFLDYMQDYTKLKKMSMSGGKEVVNKETVYEGADGLDQFLGG